MEKYKELDDAQYGVCQGRMSIDPVLIKVLTIETAYLQQSNIAITDCDARAYYNRKKMKYYPVTGKGVAEKYNQHEEGKPVLGSG
eukprot:15367043-Ditylum_brightwellii.AAC.1